MDKNENEELKTLCDGKPCENLELHYGNTPFLACKKVGKLWARMDEDKNGPYIDAKPEEDCPKIER